MAVSFSNLCDRNCTKIIVLYHASSWATLKEGNSSEGRMLINHIKASQPHFTHWWLRSVLVTAQLRNNNGPAS
jgi:hypothetical protein